MSQKLKDLQLILASSKKARFFIIAGILGILFVLFKPAGPGPLRMNNKANAQAKIGTGKIADSETNRDLTGRFNIELEALKETNTQTKRELEETRESLRQNEERTAEIMKRMLERLNEKESKAAVDTASAMGSANLGADGTAQDQDAAGTNFGATGDPLNNDMRFASLSQDDATLESFGLEEPEVAPPAPPAPKKIAFVGPGDSVRVKLLAGVNAPTDGTPYPVVFKLVGDIHGPDGSLLPLGEARLIAAAQGSLTDQRALFRLTSLNLRLPTGERKVVNVDGWIVGEDGIRGMPGVLIDPIGKAIGGAAITGAVAGVGAAISASNSRSFVDRNGGLQTIVDGDLGEYAGGRALTEGAREWSSIIRDRLNQLVPVVQVYSGREGTAVFAKSLSIEGLFEALDSGEGASSLD